jgi:broad specificity phosphatase PhoE
MISRRVNVMNKGSKLIALILLLGLPAMSIAADIFLVRHAEKQSDGTRDPGLTHEGLQRAAHLANLISSANIKTVYSTDYRRTRLTAEPSALQAGVEVTAYQPDQLAELANQLKKSEENVLVVGHSNTTPQLVDLLNGQSGSDLPEWQYDRIYLVRIVNQQVVSTLLLHLPPLSSED